MNPVVPELKELYPSAVVVWHTKYDPTVHWRANGFANVGETTDVVVVPVIPGLLEAIYNPVPVVVP